MRDLLRNLPNSSTCTCVRDVRQWEHNLGDRLVHHPRVPGVAGLAVHCTHLGVLPAVRSVHRAVQGVLLRPGSIVYIRAGARTV